MTEIVASDELRQMRHEHARLYAALETAAQLAELAGHNGLAATLRADRRHVAGEIARDECEVRDGG